MSKKRVSGFENVSGIDFSEEIEELRKQAALKTIEISHIHVVPEFNPRGRFDPQAFEEQSLSTLSESIQKDGVLSPLWVRETAPGEYDLIAGERRLRAAQNAGLHSVPALVMNVSAAQSQRLAIIENAQRLQMNIIEESYAGFRLMQEHTGLDIPDLIAHLGGIRKKREEDIHGLETLLRSTFGSGVQTWAQLRSKLFDLTDEERSATFQGKIDYSLAVMLTRLEEGERRSELLKRAIEQSLSGPQLKALIDAEVGIQKTQWQQETEEFKKILPKLSRLQGEKAQQAMKLLRELRELSENPS